MPLAVYGHAWVVAVVNEAAANNIVITVFGNSQPQNH